MKKFIASALLISSTALVAAENSQINDLQYLPDAGTTFGATNLNYYKASDRDFNESTFEVEKYESEGFNFIQTIGHSVLNNLLVSADIAYSNSQSRSTGSSSSESKGLSDIRFNGRYRLSGPENRLDILGAVTVSPGDSEVDSDGDSNSYSGGHSLAVGAEYGVKRNAFQWSFNGVLTHNLKTTEKDKSGVSTTTYKDDAHNELTLTAQLLTQITDAAYIRNFAAVNFTEEYDDNQDNTMNGQTYYQVGGEFQYLFSKDLFAKAGATAVMSGNGYNSVVMLYNTGIQYQF